MGNRLFAPFIIFMTNLLQVSVKLTGVNNKQ